MKFKAFTSSVVIFAFLIAPLNHSKAQWGEKENTAESQKKALIYQEKAKRIQVAAKSLAETSLYSMLLAGLFASYQYYTSEGPYQFMSNFKGYAGQFFLANVASSILTPQVTCFGNKVTKLGESVLQYFSIIQNPFQKIDDLEAEYQLRLSRHPTFFTPRTQRVIEKNIALVRDLLRGNATSPEAQRLTNQLEAALSLPTGIKRIGLNAELGRQSLNHRLDDILEFYPPEVRKRLKQFGKAVAVASHKFDSHVQFDSELSRTQKNGSRQKSIYLYGPPGTGKTHFVKQLAKALEMRLCILNLDRLKNEVELVGGIDDMGELARCITHTEGGQAEFFDPDPQDPEEKNYQNILLFIDEITMGLNKVPGALNVLVQLTDPGRSHIYLDGIKADVRKKRIIVILGGNGQKGPDQIERDPLEINPIYSALKSRVVRIPFTAFPQAQRQAFAHRVLEQVISEFEDESLLKGLTPEKKAEVIEALVQADKHAGVRELMYAIDDFVEQVAADGPDVPFDVYRALGQDPASQLEQ